MITRNGQKKILCLLLLLALLLACAGCTRESAAVTFFQAGKADAAVVQCGAHALMMDAGLAKNGEALCAQLRALGVERIDALILSHFDKDHIGGAAALLEEFDVGVVYQSNYPRDSEEYAAYLAALASSGTEAVTVREAVTFSLGSVRVSIDPPAQERYEKDPSNNSSLIVEVRYGRSCVLFAGDAENARLSEFLEGYARPEGTLILKVPYHGHWQKELKPFLEAVSPQVAVISCSKSEPEAEEVRKTAEALAAAAGAEVRYTYEGNFSLTLSRR